MAALRTPANQCHDLKCYKVHTNYYQALITCVDRHFCLSLSTVLSGLPERADELSVAESLVSGGGRGSEDVSR